MVAFYQQKPGGAITKKVGGQPRGLDLQRFVETLIKHNVPKSKIDGQPIRMLIILYMYS